MLDAETGRRLLELPSAGDGSSVMTADGSRIVARTPAGALDVFGVEAGRRLYSRVEYEDGSVLLWTESGHYAGTPGADRRARVELPDGEDDPRHGERLDRWGDELFDPRRVEAQQDGVRLRRAALAR